MPAREEIRFLCKSLDRNSGERRVHIRLLTCAEVQIFYTKISARRNFARRIKDLSADNASTAIIHRTSDICGSGALLASAGGRNAHCLSASRRSGALRRDLVGWKRNWIQPACRIGSDADRRDAEPGGRRGVAISWSQNHCNAGTWRCVPPRGRRRTAEGSTRCRVAARFRLSHEIHWNWSGGPDTMPRRLGNTRGRTATDLPHSKAR